MPNNSDKSNAEIVRQEIAEEIGERFRPYLDLEKIKRTIHPTCGLCKSLKGSDGHTMLAQEFIGNLIKPALTRAQSQLAKEVLTTVGNIDPYNRSTAPRDGIGYPTGNRKAKNFKSDAEKRLRDLFQRMGLRLNHD